ncbi:MAG: alkaline phosphatase family protein [Muribaculaceae bacterium]|nr:alkaline phosphatase family protein [Muribaculaceae bacterium]
MGKRQNNKITSRIAIAIIASMVVSATAHTAVTAKRPQLVVGIVVDGLNAEYLDLLGDYFSDDGFKRLMRDGVTIANLDYGTPVDPTAATAMLYTGAAPAVNGIPGAELYDKERNVTYPVLLDKMILGNFTDETYSPVPLLVSTLGDEVRIDNGGIGYVYSIAPEAASAIIMAGHAGNSAFWISDFSGKWATTTYYKEVPTIISTRNFATPLSARLDTLSWTPSMPVDRYPDLPDYKKYYPFRHTFGAGNHDRYTMFKQSAPVNREITSVGLDYLKTLRLGTRGAMDMLNLGYTVMPYPGARDADSRIETMDSYIKLDAELARLFHAIDSHVGPGNSVIFLSGTPARQSDKPDDPRWAIPTGEFSPRRAISLLNMYLIALHGNGDWVSGYHNGQFFLNTKLIKDRALDIHAVRSDAASFLARMSGVSQAWTVDDIEASKVGHQPDKMKRNTSVRHCGDVFIAVNPGWEIVDDTRGGQPTRSTQRAASTTAPFFLLSPDIPAQRIDTPVDVLSIAPTISRVLRIRSPNAAANPTISTIFAPTFQK